MSENPIIETAADRSAERSGPRRTALHTVHEELGAKFTDFGGWDMPLKYENDVAEHQAVREAAGLFDLSHMGEVRVSGRQAAELLNYALLSDFTKLAVGKAKYSIMLTQDGGVVDDLITYRLDEQTYLVVPNAANVEDVVRELTVRGAGFDADVEDQSAATALIALQGPVSAQVLAAVLERLQLADGSTELDDLKYYAWGEATVAGIEVLLARTGYTGEDGFELYAAHEMAQQLWRALLEAGESWGVAPAGLAARDSLRLEAGMPLYGHELGTEITPFASGLGMMVHYALKSTADFVGREALERLRREHDDDPRARVLVGLKGLTKRPARAGSVLLADREGELVEIGEVTSGIPSPTLGHPIAMALVERTHADPGTEISVRIRGREAPFEVVELPFYRRGQ